MDPKIQDPFSSFFPEYRVITSKSTRFIEIVKHYLHRIYRRQRQHASMLTQLMPSVETMFGQCWVYTAEQCAVLCHDAGQWGKNKWPTGDPLISLYIIIPHNIFNL